MVRGSGVRRDGGSGAVRSDNVEWCEGGEWE